jgi:hypothetical protein
MAQEQPEPSPAAHDPAAAMLPELGALYRFWRAAKEDRALPRRAEFTPDALRPWLGWLSVYERTEEDDFRIRLDGTKIVAMTGEDWTGRLVSEVDQRFGADLLHCCREVCRLNLPLFDSGIPLFQKQYSFAQRLILPVARSSDVAEQIILALFPLKREDSPATMLTNRRLMLPG